MRRLGMWFTEKNTKFKELIELHKLNWAINKVCKKSNSIHLYQTRSRYAYIQKQIFYEVNKTEMKQTSINNFYPEILLSHLHDLHTEFPYVALDGFWNSANGLCRQVIEIYIQALYCRLKPDYQKRLMERDNEKFSNIKGKIEEIKKSNLQLPYIDGAPKSNFLDNLLKEFNFTSNRFHPSSNSLSEKIWIIDQDNKAHSHLRYSIKRRDLIIFFPKGSPVHPEIQERIIDQFYQYSELNLSEIRLSVT